MFRVTRLLKRSPSFQSVFVRRASQQASTGNKVQLSEETPGFRESGAVATDYELAAGKERYEYLTTLKGEDPWTDMHPVYLTKKGTAKDPIVVKGFDAERYIGCTGFPADSHEPVYLTVRPHKNGHVDRCPHCGNAFKYEQLEDHHH
ncbi:cytochrome c oxidase subunit VB-domain-containing protein [Gorgonomyces haynaldii]|nr:cytochrome c oxidase subunit VB-domain-containing protein [Gorgonomyces haynaldii]